MTQGPTLPISQEIHALKYRLEGESFEECMERLASTLSDGEEHYTAIKDILLNQRFLPAGRIQASIGTGLGTTALNCFVMQKIPDSMAGIMDVLKEAALTMRLGGGVGYDFSTIRPKNALIKTLGSKSSGPISFMAIYDTLCKTISSAGHRRGAMMGVMRVDHPDIREFIHAKRNEDQLTQFNISVGVTDKFMNAVVHDTEFDLIWDGKVHETVYAVDLWEEIMESNWDWAEPGILFLDTINEMNNLYYCEEIAATNPCAEQPLPPYGACLLGSFNLTKYLVKGVEGNLGFSLPRLYDDIPHVVRMLDNVIDNTNYPLPEQEAEAKAKRRIGIGVTGLANAGEVLGYAYGSDTFIAFQRRVLDMILNEAYSASCLLAREKGCFPLYDSELYQKGKFVDILSDGVKYLIEQHGLRNSHLTSIAPTGTISLTANNISSGLEPVFSHTYTRKILMQDGFIEEVVDDWAFKNHGVRGKTSDQLSAEDHLRVLAAAVPYIDSSISKTCNVNSNMSKEDFSMLYIEAWKQGAKGLTTYNPGGKRYGILNKVEVEPAGEACFIDPETGTRSCE